MVGRPKKSEVKRRVQVSLTLSRELITKLDKLARQQDMPRSRIIEISLRLQLGVGQLPPP